MISERFYGVARSFSLQELQDMCQKAQCSVEIVGNLNQMFQGAWSLKEAKAQHITYVHKGALKNTSYEKDIVHTKAGLVVLPPAYKDMLPSHACALITPFSYRAFATILKAMYSTKPCAMKAALSFSSSCQVHPSAIIDASACIEDHVIIGPYAVVEAHAHIKKNTVLGAHVYIGQGSVIGENCDIASHVSVTHSVIGHAVRIKSGARIGQRGFAFDVDDLGMIDMPQMGGVRIEDGAEIGANTTIDRGALHDTRIGAMCRIDNLVQIAHNVHLASYCVLAAQTGISGSTRLEQGVMVGGQAGFAGHLTIGAGARIAAQSGVMRDVAPKDTLGGSPAVPAREWHKQTIALKRLTSPKT